MTLTPDESIISYLWMIGKPSANRRSFDCEQFFIDILGKWAFWSYSRDKCQICLAYRFGVYHVGAGGFACPAGQAASRLWSAPGAPFTPARFESTLVSPYQNKTRIFRCGSYFGGGGWIRTTVGIASRFTVCPLWPLGNTPMLSSQAPDRLASGQCRKLAPSAAPPLPVEPASPGFSREKRMA